MTNLKSKLLIGVLVSLLMTVGIFAQDLKVIAVHFGNPENAKILSQEHYPGFSFYTTDGSSYYYSEDKRSSVYLGGYYGEVPEKMGFSANYTTDKKITTPYYRGIIYLVGTNGVIAAQTSATQRFLSSSYEEDYYKDFDAMKKVLRGLKRGKVTKALADKDQQYFKSTPSAEREPLKKAEIDKKGKGLLSWHVPNITIYDAEGEAQNLRELCEGENCMLVFYTLNAVHHVQGSSKDGSILKEWDPEPPHNYSKTMQQSGEKAESAKQLMTSLIKSTAKAKTDKTYDEFTTILDFAKSLKDFYK